MSGNSLEEGYTKASVMVGEALFLVLTSAFIFIRHIIIEFSNSRSNTQDVALIGESYDKIPVQ